MSDNSESFKNEFITQLFNSLPHDQIKNVIDILDRTLPNYDILFKPVSIITSDGIPQPVKEFIASKAINNLSIGTLKQYKLRLEDFFRMVKCPVTDITTNDIYLYLHYYKDRRNASDSYLDNIRRELNSFFTWCVKHRYTLHNPCDTVDKIKHQEAERQPLNDYELEVLRFACKDIREKAIIDFFYSTGVRVSEFRDVTLEDINWEKRSVVIRHGKGNKRRVVFFNAEAEVSLRKYLETRTDNCTSLFVTKVNPYRKMCVKTIQDTIKKIANRVDMHVYPHKIRHTFATHGINSGMPLEKLQMLMGHKEAHTTMIYAKINTYDLQREHQRVYA